MRVFKNRSFHRWADKEGLTDAGLWQAIHEIERGLVDASSNVRTDELRALQRYAMELFGYSEAALEKALGAKVLIEVKADG